MSGGTFQVTMLDIMMAPFESWLRAHHLVMATIPDGDPDEFIVVPAPERRVRDWHPGDDA